MCLAVPMKVDRVEGLIAYCSAMGVERTANLLMMQNDPPQPGEYIIISVGYAQTKISEEDALASWELFGQIIDATAPQTS